MRKFTATVFAALLAATCALFVACAKTPSHTYWNIEKKQVSGGELQYYATFYLSEAGADKKIDEIWVNIDTFGEEKAYFNVVFGSANSVSNLKYNERNDILVDRMFASDAEGWVMIADDLNVAYKYVQIYVTKSMHFNEIYFLTADHELFKATLSEAGTRQDKDNNINRYVFNEDSSAEDEHLANNLLDEQKEFDYSVALRYYEAAKDKNPELFKVETEEDQQE